MIIGEKLIVVDGGVVASNCVTIVFIRKIKWAIDRLICRHIKEYELLKVNATRKWIIAHE